MAGVGRVGDGEYAARVNAAVELAAAGTAQAARVLADRFGVSVRQARRYLDDAGHGRVEIPDRAVAFTVKLPEGLVGRVRAYAAEHRLAISAVVAAALVEFLARDRGGRPER
jgi:non-ribosomal peptide synthetase component E (peptide arylation enzyme)